MVGLVVQDYTKRWPVATHMVMDFEDGQRAATSFLHIPPHTVEITVDETAWDPEFEGSKVLVGFSTSAACHVIRIPVGTHVIDFFHTFDSLLVREADNPGVDLTKIRVRLARALDHLPAAVFKFAMHIVGMEPGMAVCQGICGHCVKGEEHFRPSAPLYEHVHGLVVLSLSAGKDVPGVKPTGTERSGRHLTTRTWVPSCCPCPGRLC